MIKPTLQIKKELKEKGWNLKGVKIKVERLYDFVWVYVPSQEDYKDFDKAVADVACVPVYNVMMKEL